jgi:hypothetical protein
LHERKHSKKDLIQQQAERAIRAQARDADTQEEPCEYDIGRHANETLAICYGIANLQKEVIPYYYFDKGGVKTHNPDRVIVKSGV